MDEENERRIYREGELVNNWGLEWGIGGKPRDEYRKWSRGIEGRIQEGRSGKLGKRYRWRNSRERHLGGGESGWEVGFRDRKREGKKEGRRDAG
jgi:hypothetical protein